MVTITIGGNDAGFKDVLTACYASNGYPCWATLLAAEGRVKRSLPQELQSTYTAVQAAAGPQAGLVAVGYPKIFPDSYSLSVAGHCGWLRFEEWAAIRKISADLEAAQKVAAAKAGVLFHSVQSVLKGHELCTADSWVKSVSAVNREYSAHPLLKGQQAIADDMYTWLGR